MRRKGNNYKQDTRKVGNIATCVDTVTYTKECTSGCARVKSNTLNHFLEQLYEKRAPKREAALSFIIQRFRAGHEDEFCEKNFCELYYNFLKSFKKGLVKERCLAVEALGLLAINIGCGENAHELYREATPVLIEALNTETHLKKLKLILDSLTIITFVGGNELKETELSMQSIWNFLHSRADFEEAQTAAVSSWSLLLTTMDSCSISFKQWRGAILFLKKLLETDHESTQIEARQALALILEIGCLEKFGGDTWSMEEMNVKNFNTSPLEIQYRMQFNFLKRLLGSTGFIEHLKVNELLHDVLNFKPAQKPNPHRELYVAERDEVTINPYVPDVRREDSHQRIHKSQNSVFVKARTQIRNKNRDIKGKEQWLGD